MASAVSYASIHEYNRMQPEGMPHNDPAAFTYESYQQYAHERNLHDQAIHHSMAQVSSAATRGSTTTAKSSTASAPSSTGNNARTRPNINTSNYKGPSSTASSAPSSPDGASKNGDKENERNEGLKSNRLCTMPGCKKRVRSKGLCKAHGGGRRCMVDGCERSSQGQGLCIRHGGGKRCTQAGCTKASQSNGLCKAHGGGLRCQTPGCTKSSQGGGFCRAHGGGQRCEKEGCNKGAQRGGFCAGHGGSRFCQHPDCTKNDRGGGFCAEHGGGKRCDHAGCNKPARKKGKCSYHANAAKGKTSKDTLTNAPQHIMDMRQITTPTFSNMGSMAKDMRDHSAMDHNALRSHAGSAVNNYARPGEMDQRYAKGYESSAPAGSSSQYLPMHGDQRSYDPMTMHGQQQHSSSRHYMGPGAMDNASLPPVSSGYSSQSSHKQPHPMDRSYSTGRDGPMKASHHQPQSNVNVNPYSQWSSKSEGDYFDIKEQPSHHHQQPYTSSQYHHHHMSESAYSNPRTSYYHHPQHQQPQQGSSSEASNPPNMMYYPPNGYPPHQMHGIPPQMTLL